MKQKGQGDVLPIPDVRSETPAFVAGMNLIVLGIGGVMRAIDPSKDWG